MSHLCTTDPLEGEREDKIKCMKKKAKHKKEKRDELKRNHLRCFRDDVPMMKEQPESRSRMDVRAFEKLLGGVCVCAFVCLYKCVFECVSACLLIITQKNVGKFKLLAAMRRNNTLSLNTWLQLFLVLQQKKAAASLQSVI